MWYVQLADLLLTLNFVRHQTVSAFAAFLLQSTVPLQVQMVKDRQTLSTVWHGVRPLNLSPDISEKARTLVSTAQSRQEHIRIKTQEKTAQHLKLLSTTHILLKAKVQARTQVIPLLRLTATRKLPNQQVSHHPSPQVSWMTSPASQAMTETYRFNL